MSWQSHLREQMHELGQYADAVERQRDNLLSTLTDIAAGLVSSNDPDSWGHATKLQMKASRALQNAAKDLSKLRPRCL